MPQPALTRDPIVVRPSTPAADCSPQQRAELRYMAAIDALVEDAREHRHVGVLVDVLTWHLARIGFANGMFAAGDILRCLGGHFSHIAEQHAAQREAEAAKEAGHAPN